MSSASARPAALIFLSAVVLHLPAGVALSDDRPPASLLCQLVLQEERLERDDLELSLKLALTQMQAAERIHALLDDLWQRKAVERLVYLRGRHDRDVARIEHDSARLKLERQEAALEQYRLVCESLSAGTPGETARRAVESAFRRYARAACEIHAADVQRGEVDVAFFEEVLQSMRDLRVNQVATEQDVILSERDVEMARKSLEDSRLRETRCRAETQASPAPPHP